MRSRLGRHQEVPCFRAAILPYVPSPVRREENLGVSAQVLPKFHRPSPNTDRIGSSTIPTPASVGYWFTTLQSSLYATARTVACPPVPVRPGGDPPAAEDFYARAFPRRGHPPPESGMTTRHPWGDTVTGLSPAGSLPLQAATVFSSTLSSRGHTLAVAGGQALRAGWNAPVFSDFLSSRCCASIFGMIMPQMLPFVKNEMGQASPREGGAERRAWNDACPEGEGWTP